MILAECLLGDELFCLKDFLFREGATSSELEGGGMLKSEPFLYHRYGCGAKESNVSSSR